MNVSDIISIIVQFAANWKSEWLLTEHNSHKIEIVNDNPLEVQCKPERIPPVAVYMKDNQMISMVNNAEY